MALYIYSLLILYMSINGDQNQSERKGFKMKSPIKKRDNSRKISLNHTKSRKKFRESMEEARERG